MEKVIFKFLAVGILFLSSSIVGFAADEKPAMAKEKAPSPEQQAMMARMQAYSTPNEHHEFLKSLAGSWKANVKFWMDPSGQPEESMGTSEAKMILNGHFLEQNYVGTAMGKPFEGRGIYGYDNMRKEYAGIWFDNMATGIMLSAGQYDATTKMMKDEGSMSCPITNETHRWYRSVSGIIDADHYTYETFMKDKDGKEFRSMLISYTRA